MGDEGRPDVDVVASGGDRVIAANGYDGASPYVPSIVPGTRKVAVPRRSS